MRSASAEARQIETDGIGQTQQFTIKANAKAFKILIDGLYSDKPRAVIRELTSNAFDAHAAVGKEDVPFDLHIPTRLAPHFSVRDYGVSMDEETVFTVFTTLFDSTKEETNSQLGKFGLGCKTPFAITDVFEVTTYLEGERRAYTCYLNEGNLPMISLMESTPTDEPNGVQIQFPVEYSDIFSFQNAARQVLRGFDVLPNVTPTELKNVEPAMTPVEGLVHGDNFVFTGGRSYAKQGVVLYPIDIEIFKANKVVYALLQEGLTINFPIGDLDVTPSRESLSYDDTTTANIVATCERIARTCSEEFDREMASAKSEEEYDKVFTSIQRRIPGFLNGGFVSKYDKNPYRKTSNVHFGTTKCYSRTLFDAAGSFDVKRLPFACRNGRSVRQFSGDTTIMSKRPRIVWNRNDAFSQIKIYPGVEIVVMHYDYDNPPKRLAGRVRSALEENGFQAHYISDDRDRYILLGTPDIKSDMRRLRWLFRYADVKTVDLANVEPYSSGKNEAGNKPAIRTLSGLIVNELVWAEADSANTVYVPSVSRSLLPQLGRSPVYVWSDVPSSWKYDVDVFAVPKGRIKEAEEKGLKTMEDFIKDKVNELVGDDGSLPTSRAHFSRILELFPPLVANLDLIPNFALNREGPLADLLRLLRDTKQKLYNAPELGRDLQRIVFLVHGAMLNAEDDIREFRKKVSAMSEEAQEMYPMLQFNDEIPALRRNLTGLWGNKNRRIRRELSPLIHYIDLIDASR